jgi:hypothetical protein
MAWRFGDGGDGSVSRLDRSPLAALDAHLSLRCASAKMGKGAYLPSPVLKS